MKAAGSLRARLATPVLALGCLLVTGFTQDYLRRVTAGEMMFIPAPADYIGVTVDPRIIRRLLGVRLVFADMIWIDTLIKADTLHEREGYSSVYRAFRNSLALDPDNVSAYYVAGMYLSVMKDDIKGATAIMREGVRYMDTHPYNWEEAWRLPFALGYNLMFEEHDIDEGSKWIQRADQLARAPQMVHTLAKHVSTEAGRLEVGSRVLNEMYRQATRPEDKIRIEAKMMALAERQEVLELNEKFQIFLKSTKAYVFPKKKQFQLFMRSVGHTGKSLVGDRFEINDSGNIVTAQ